MHTLHSGKITRQRGISLLEVMVVIGIVALLAAIGIGYHQENIIRNQSNQELEQFTSNLRTMPSYGQQSGLLANKNGVITRNPALLNDVSLKSVSTGRFYWKCLQNGDIKAEGVLGSRQRMSILATKSYLTGGGDPSSDITHGAWMEVWSANEKTLRPDSKLMVILFQPDGSPLYDGVIKVNFLGSGDTIKKTTTATLDKVGGISVDLIKAGR